MKVLTVDSGSFEDKVNFIDENNVFLGYDLGQCCCEEADWFVSINLIDDMDYDELDKIREVGKDFDFSGFVFDTKFNQKRSWRGLDAGEAEIFKIINKDKVYYIYIYNSHNGYYSHGFEFKIDDEVISEGNI